jgi:7-cyano-7-deazaguanine tRNA-ribosyltransferase
MALSGPPSSLQPFDEGRRLSIMVDYLFGKGVARALPKQNLRLVYSRRSGRVKLVFYGERLFATVKPNGAMALSLHGAELLAKSPKFRENCVTVADETAGFVHGGRSVFCKFVTSAGKNIFPRSEVAVLDSKGNVLGVGTAVLNGKVMKQFKSGAAVKIRAGRE